MASFSISIGGNHKDRKNVPSSPKNGTKRTYAALDDADSDDEDVGIGKRQNVTHFDVSAGGAVDVSRPKVVEKALVIKPQANRDWKQASLRNKRQKYGLPPEDEEKAKQDFVAPVPSTSYGLNVHRSGTEAEATTDEVSQDNHQAERTGDVSIESALAKPKTDDERAIAALMGFKEDSTLTIPALTEDEALERDVHEAPDAPTLADYAAVPVEDFGAAMLRGMGWKEGQGIGKQKGQKVVKAKVPERRPALLGIGAKPDAAVAAELGAWGAGAKGKRRPDIVYNPLVLKNSKTGEQLTEDELKAKLQDQKEREANERYVQEPDQGYREESSRRHHRDTHDSNGREERRQKESRRERYYEDDRTRSRRERSISYDRSREKRRDRHGDSKYDDRKDRDRRRDRDDYGNRERKRDDGRRYDDDRDRRHRR